MGFVARDSYITSRGLSFFNYEVKVWAGAPVESDLASITCDMMFNGIKKCELVRLPLSGCEQKGEGRTKLPSLPDPSGLQNLQIYVPVRRNFCY